MGLEWNWGLKWDLSGTTVGLGPSLTLSGRSLDPLWSLSGPSLTLSEPSLDLLWTLSGPSMTLSGPSMTLSGPSLDHL